MNEELRKKEEARFHDMVRDEALERKTEEFEYLTSNRKFYSVVRKRVKYETDFILKNCIGKKVLDFCCGDGGFTLSLAEKGIDAYGFDISDTSIEIAKRKAKEKGIEDRAHFFVMDAENLQFDEKYFDFVFCNGVLHHLNIDKAFSEIKRVLRPEGKVFCVEPLKYNPVFQAYRLLTPHLRTEWEKHHILKIKDIKFSEKYFTKIEMRFFDLFTLMAVPFRNTFIFNPLLSVLEMIDAVILRIPGIKWWSWEIVFILSEPGTDDRKIKEIEYYDKEASESKEEEIEAGSKGGFSPLILESYRFLYELLKKEAGGKNILDYGCGTGIHLKYLAGVGKSVIGVDLSKKSLEIAQRKIERDNLVAKVLVMDCESLDFENNTFDIVFNGGVFSSLDLDKALPELSRALKLNGTVIGIETFGHNPITNLKRRINKILGKRTGWAAEHILKTEDFEKFKKYFKSVEVHYFHLISWAIFPFLALPGGSILLNIGESLDRFILKLLPFLRKYSFKVVFVLRK